MNIQKTGAQPSQTYKPSTPAVTSEEKTLSVDSFSFSESDKPSVRDIMRYAALGAIGGAAASAAGDAMSGHIDVLPSVVAQAGIMAAVPTAGVCADLLLNDSAQTPKLHMSLGPKARAFTILGTGAGALVLGATTGISPVLAGAIAGGLTHGIAAAFAQ